MNLKMKDIVGLLEVPERTIHKWIREKKLPAYKINNQYMFNKTEIKEWVLKNNIPFSEKMLDLDIAQKPVCISELLKKGGIFYHIKGASVVDAIKNAVTAIYAPDEINKDKIIFSLIEREEMMPTAMGNGIAIPHPRNPIIADIENESVSMCFLDKEIDYKAIDGIFVHTLFIVLSAKPTRHLAILSKISFLCQQKSFGNLLKEHAEKEVILKYIEDKEKEWRNSALNAS